MRSAGRGQDGGRGYAHGGGRGRGPGGRYIGQAEMTSSISRPTQVVAEVETKAMVANVEGATAQGSDAVLTAES